VTLVQACLNGARRRSEHPALPCTPAELAAAARACVEAGAGALHAHARDAAGAESLAPGDVAATVEALRAAAPGVPISLSTGLWIAGGDAARRAALVGAWDVRPDLVSLNVSEPGWRALAATLRAVDVGIEVGLASVADARELASDPIPVVRALIEVPQADPAAAVAEAAAMEAPFEEAGFDAPRLHHGEGPATWAVIDAALALGRDVRVGLEDVLSGPDGEPVADNAALVALVVARAGFDPRSVA
jgi:uncharacterized protein (DUF849 family)